MTAEQPYLDLYREAEATLREHSCAPLNAVRDQALADLRRLGLPTRRLERYKYTDVPAAFAPDYGVNPRRIQFPVNPYEAFRCHVPNLSTQLYFVVNDAFYDRALPAGELPQGVFIGSLCAAARQLPQVLEHYYARAARTGDDGLTAFNTLLAQDGLLVYIPRGVRMGRSVQVVNISRADVDLLANRRVLVVLEEGAEATLLFCDHDADERAFLTTQVMEVYLGAGSRLHLYELEETHGRNTRLSNLYVHQEAGSRLEHQTVTLHNGLTRNRTDIRLLGEGAEATAYGCVISDKQQHVDNNLLIDHQAAGCRSQVLYKYVLDGQSTGAFAGHVLVRPGAQRTESQETNANLCVSDEAHIYTQPMLEIYADDVKCNHGSTVGQLDEAALFYMRQRGVPEAEARRLLQQAFLYEVIRPISLEPLRERLSRLIEMRLRGELDKCKDCHICR